MFPATDSNLCATALIERVLSHYDLGAIRCCHLQHRGLNDTYKVEVVQSETYYLRVYRAGWRTRDQIDTEIAILLHLAQRQASISRPVLAKHGQALIPLDCVEGRRWAALFTSAPGQEIDFIGYNELLAGSYGEAVATVHNAAEGFEGRPNRPVLDLAELLDQPLRLLTSALSHRPEDVDFVTRLGNRLRQRIQGQAGLEIGFCHGDFHGRNACEIDGAFTFYDFDCCGWGYRAYDLAVFPWAFAVRHNSVERIEAMGRAFLGGYQRQRAVGRIDVEAIIPFVAIRQIWLLGLHIATRDRFGWGWINDAYFTNQLKVLRDWEQNWLSRSGNIWLQAGTDEI